MKENTNCHDQHEIEFPALMQWMEDRAALNHNWLQVRYLTFVRAWKDEITALGQGKQTVPEVIPQLIVWQEKKIKWQNLLNECEQVLSPRQYLALPPLEQLADEQKIWLGDVIHQIFCIRSGIKESVEQLRKKLAVVDGVVTELAEGTAGEHGGDRLYDECLEFSRLISALPSRIQVY